MVRRGKNSNKNKITYPREEVYFPTVAKLLDKDKDKKFLNSEYTFVAWGQPNFTPTPQQIVDVAQGKMKGRYSVKIVARNINDPVRFQIATQIGNYRAKSLDFIKLKMHKMYRKFFNQAAGRKRVFVSFKQEEAKISTAFDMRYSEYFLSFNVVNNSVNFENLLAEMKSNREYLFVICAPFYPTIAVLLENYGFRENVNFIDGNLFLD